MTTNTKYVIEDKKALEIDTMLRKIAWKKHSQYETCSSRFEFEDVVSELWLNALAIIERQQRIDMDLIAHASFQKIVDLVRKEIKRPIVGFDPSTLEWTSEESEGGANSYLADIPGFCSKFMSPETYSEITEMIGLFDEGTKHRTYLQLAILYFCDEETAGLDSREVDFSDMDGRQDDYWQTWIAHKLGYANACSSGYQKVRNQVQAKLAQSGYAKGFADAIARLIKLGYAVE